MTLTTSQAFDVFLGSITATEEQRTSFIPSRKASVDTRLAGAFPATSDMPYTQGVLMGSARKGTIIRPLDDIDVLAVFSNINNAWTRYQSDSRSFLYRVREVYNGLLTQQVGARGQAVRVFYNSGGHVDIAPVFDQGGGVYSLPAGDGTWLSTAPTLAADWYLGRHAALSYQLSPVVRLLKAWNRSHSKHLQSFHLETMAAAMFSQLGSNHRQSLSVFFENASSRLEVQDPGHQSGSLSSYLPLPTRLLVNAAFTAASTRAQQALDAERRGDHGEAKRLWRIVLGDEFPVN